MTREREREKKEKGGGGIHKQISMPKAYFTKQSFLG